MREKETPQFYMSGVAILKNCSHFCKKAAILKIGNYFEFEKLAPILNLRKSNLTSLTRKNLETCYITQIFVMKEKEIRPFYMSRAAILEMAAFLKYFAAVLNFGFLGQMNSRKGLLH